MKKFVYSLLLVIGVILILSGAFSLGTGSVGVVVVLVIAGGALVILSVKQLRKNQDSRHIESEKPQQST